MPGMLSSIAEARVGISHAPIASACAQAWPASRTRSAIAFSSGVDSLDSCELTIRFIVPCRYSDTSRERCRAIGSKPICRSSVPSACGCEVPNSMNSMPSMPTGLDGSGRRSSTVMAACPELARLLNYLAMSLIPSADRSAAMRKPKAPEANRARILAAAIDEFAARGFKGASMDAIAARTETTRALINYYFGSKEKLYIAVLEQVYGEIREAEGKLDLDHLAPAEAVRRIVEFTYRYYIAHEG